MNKTLADSNCKAAEPVCYNCNHPKPVTDPFCRYCGQKHTNLKDGVFHFVGEFITELISLDGRVFRTLGNLFGRPGQLTNEFMRGRRKRYLPPVQIYLFSTFLFFFAFGSWAQPKSDLLDDVNVSTSIDGADKTELTTRSNADSEQSGTETAEAEVDNRDQSEGDDEDSADDDSSGDVALVQTEEQVIEQAVDETINVNLFSSKVKLNSEDFRSMATMTDEEIIAKLRENNVEASPWMVTLLRNTSKLTTKIGVQNYFATLVAIASQVALVMLPFLAFSLRIMFLRSSKSLLQSFVLSSHLHSFTNLLLTPMLLLGLSGFWVFLVAATFGGYHGYRNLKNVYNESWFWTTFKLGLISTGYVFALLLGFTVISTVALFLS